MGSDTGGGYGLEIFHNEDMEGCLRAEDPKAACLELHARWLEKMKAAASVAILAQASLAQDLVYSAPKAELRQPAMEAMKEKAKKAIEDQMGDNAPPYLKPFFACCGGPVATMEKCLPCVPADKQDTVKSAIEKYKGM